VLIALVGCSSGTPRNLADARAAYQRAAAGPASQRTPAQLHVAHTALIAAEKTYDDEGDSANTRDRAYVALRKAELAEVQAAIAQDDERAANARRQLEMAKNSNQVSMEKDLERTRAQLQAEQQRRQEAERVAAEALSKLSSVATVKQEPRGVVITLSGAVIFASNKSDLLPTAKAKLNQVADALKKSDPNSKFEVDGYTDSRGPAQLNQELSQRRAEAVRNYLVSQGVPDDKITAQGLGPSNPVADNNTAEGRANNRRVEIIVKSDNSQAANDQPQQQQSSNNSRPQAGQQSAYGAEVQPVAPSSPPARTPVRPNTGQSGSYGTPSVPGGSIR
jgi:outer membrane protein OmpA-like peptidoglycan-associated protein